MTTHLSGRCSVPTTRNPGPRSQRCCSLIPEQTTKPAADQPCTQNATEPFCRRSPASATADRLAVPSTDGDRTGRCCYRIPRGRCGGGDDPVATRSGQPGRGTGPTFCQPGPSCAEPGRRPRAGGAAPRGGWSIAMPWLWPGSATAGPAPSTCTRWCRCRPPSSSSVPDHPDPLAWLWQHWGTTQALRHVATGHGPHQGTGTRAGGGRDKLRLSFWSADWTPWRAFGRIRADWPTLRFDVQPHYDAS